MGEDLTDCLEHFSQLLLSMKEFISGAVSKVNSVNKVTLASCVTESKLLLSKLFIGKNEKVFDILLRSSSLELLSDHSCELILCYFSLRLLISERPLSICEFAGNYVRVISLL